MNGCARRWLAWVYLVGIVLITAIGVASAVAMLLILIVYAFRG